MANRGPGAQNTLDKGREGRGSRCHWHTKNSNNANTIRNRQINGKWNGNINSCRQAIGSHVDKTHRTIGVDKRHGSLGATTWWTCCQNSRQLLKNHIIGEGAWKTVILSCLHNSISGGTISRQNHVQPSQSQSRTATKIRNVPHNYRLAMAITPDSRRTQSEYYSPPNSQSASRKKQTPTPHKKPVTRQQCSGPQNVGLNARAVGAEMGQGTGTPPRVQSPPEYVNKHVTHPPRVAACLLGQTAAPTCCPGLAYLRLPCHGQCFRFHFRCQFEFDNCLSVDSRKTKRAAIVK